MSSAYPGTVRAGQITGFSSVVVTVDAAAQTIRGGKTFFQLGELDATPSFGYAQAPETPGRFVGDSGAPSGSTYKYADLVVADRLSNAHRGYWMSAIAWAGYARYAAVGFHQYASENGVNDVGYLDVLACPSSGVGVPSETTTFGVPDDPASAWRWRAGFSAGYLRLPSLGTAVTNSPQKPATNATNLFAVTKAALATFGLSQPAGNYLPLIHQYDNGSGGSSYGLVIDSVVGDLRYWTQTVGMVVTTGGQTFSGLKSFASGVLADSLDLYTADGSARGSVRASKLVAIEAIEQDDTLAYGTNFYLQLGNDNQVVPDAPPKNKVRLFCRSGALGADEPRNSYYEELQDSGDPLAVPFMRFAKAVDGTDVHAVASDRAVGRIASRAFSAGPGATYGLAGDAPLDIGVSDAYGAVYEVDFSAAAAVLLSNLSLLCSTTPASGTLRIRLTTQDPGGMTFPATRAQGFLGVITIDLAEAPATTDHVDFLGYLDAEGRGAVAGPLVLVRTPTDGCRLYAQLAYSGANAADFGADPTLGGQYVQTGMEEFAHPMRQQGPMTPAD